MQCYSNQQLQQTSTQKENVEFLKEKNKISRINLNMDCYYTRFGYTNFIVNVDYPIFIFDTSHTHTHHHRLKITTPLYSLSHNA